MHPRDWITHLTQELSPAAREELEQRAAKAATQEDRDGPSSEKRLSPMATFTQNLTAPAIRLMQSW